MPDKDATMLNDQRILELLPCPFCGSDVGFHKDDHGEGTCEGCHYIHCSGCGLMADYSQAADPHNESPELIDLQHAIVKYWNTRAPAQSLTMHRGKPVGYFDVYDGKDGKKSYIQIKEELADDTSIPIYANPVSVTPVGDWALRLAAKVAYDQCIGRQTGDDEGSTRWLEAGKCARQSRDAILALIPAIPTP